MREPSHLKDLAGGFVLLAIAAAYWWAIGDIADSTLADEVGAAGLPRILAVLLAGFGLVLVARAMLAGALNFGRAPRPVPAAAASSDDREPMAELPRALAFLAFGAAYIAVLPVIGYLPAVALLIAAVAVFEGARPSWRTGLVALGGAVLYWAVFVRLLGVRQPPGWFF